MGKTVYLGLFDKPLNQEEENELFRRMKNGDNEAKKVLIEANIPLVIYFAKKYTNKSVPIEDLTQEGVIGLMRALDKYDSDKGFKFSTYAAWYIQQAFHQAVVKNARTIYLPSKMVEDMNKMNKCKIALTYELNREPTSEELMNSLGMSKTQFDFLKDHENHLVSLDAFVGEELDTELISFVGDRNNNTEEIAINNVLREQCVKLLQDSTLTEREVEVLLLRFGFYGNKTFTLQEIGDMIGLTRERARQIVNTSIDKIKKSSYNVEFEDLYESIVNNR